MLPKPGDRVEFVSTTIRLPSAGFTDELLPGARGEVSSINGREVIRVLWDNGMRYPLYHGYDVFIILPEQEKEEV